MNIVKKVMSLVTGVCLCLAAEAATAPQYHFYSTNMHAKGAQSGFFTSRVNQTGKVTYEGTTYDVRKMYGGNQGGGNARAFSANVFTQPGSVFIAGAMTSSVQGSGSQGSGTSGSRGIQYGGTSVSLPALNVSRQNAADLAVATATESRKGFLREEAANPGTPGAGEIQLPVGDALLPLLLLAIGYGVKRMKLKDEN